MMLKHSVAIQVQYAALHNFEDREEDFRADVVTLRRRFTSEGVHSVCAHAPAAFLQPVQLTVHLCSRRYFLQSMQYACTAGIGIHLSVCMQHTCTLRESVGCTHRTIAQVQHATHVCPRTLHTCTGIPACLPLKCSAGSYPSVHGSLLIMITLENVRSCNGHNWGHMPQVQTRWCMSARMHCQVMHSLSASTKYGRSSSPRRISTFLHTRYAQKLQVRPDTGQGFCLLPDRLYVGCLACCATACSSLQ